MITIFIESKGDKEPLMQTVESVLQQAEEFRKNLCVVILPGDSCTVCEKEIVLQYEKKMQIRLACFTEEPDECIRLELKDIKTKYFTVIRAGEEYILDALERAHGYLEQNLDKTDAVLIRNVRKKEGVPGAAKDPVNGLVVSLNKPEEVMQLPGCLRGILFVSESVLSCETEISLTDGRFEEFVYAVLAKKQTVAYAKNAFFSGETPLSNTNTSYPEWNSAKWYFDVTENYCRKILDQYRGHAIEPFIQVQVLFALKVQFRVNVNSKNKGVFSAEEQERYFNLCRQCLSQISNEYIFATKGIQRERKMNFALKSAFVRLKYENKSQGFYISKEENPRLYCKDETVNQTVGLIPYVTLDLLEFEKGNLKLDAAIDRFVVGGAVKLKVLSGGNTVEHKVVNRFAQTRFFGQTVTEKCAFRVSIPAERLEKKQMLEFALEDAAGNRMILPVLTADYQAKLTRLLKNSYWTFDEYRVTLKMKEGELPTGLNIVRSGKVANLFQEIKLLTEMVTASYGSKRMFAMRCLYWLTYPVYSHKNIWLTFDKLYKGGDCGEYFYKYMCTRKDTDVIPAYVIREDVPDAKRLKKEGYPFLPYKSWKQKLMYMHAKMIFATHSSVHSFCGFSKWEVRFIQDRLRAVNTCIQHGLSVQDLTFDSNRIVNNNKRYYCASRYEVENLSRPAYDYDPDVLRLTGIPRYDGLINQDKKQILITPTWRAYIAMPAVMGESRPYNPDFKNTDYYRIFQSLLENKKLSDMAAKTGYKIVYLLHPVIGSQKEDFRPANDIEIVSAVDVNYEKILTESSLMVTDYSGVQFDFAYMRKPVVYFHPPKLPPHYEEGGFFYDTQGFGEICKEIDELVDVLCGYMESGCQLKEFYRARQDDFFAFEDLESCRRIYEDALEYQRTQK